ncbi:phosphoribosylanthranilate isomerase [Flavobacteriaceae bacterium M23B6Z8]
MKIKVCGMKYPENISEVAALQPDYMGFIFWEPSKRHVADNSIQNIPTTIKKTGVFVDETQSHILDKVKTHELDAVQLHGKQSPQFCTDLKKALVQMKNVQVEIIKVFSIAGSFDFDLLEPYESSCDFYLFDTKGKLPGGNGYTFDWSVLASYPSTKPYFLSGGIDSASIDKIKAFLKEPAAKYCYAVDVNSKFETKPGLKDVSLLATFFNVIKKQKIEL